jgi:hypothetical protein
MIHIHLDKLRGVIAYMLGRTTVNNPGVADWERLRRHHRKCMGAIDIFSECRINILSCSLDRYEGGLLRVFRTRRIVILVISGMLSL